MACALDYFRTFPLFRTISAIKSLPAILQERGELLYGTAAVADAVLSGGTHLRKGLVVAVGEEHRVVAEAVGTALFRQDNAVHATFEEVGLPVEDERDDGLETGAAVSYTLHLAQQFQHVVLVGAALAGIAGGLDPRTAVQSQHLQPRVVGKAVATVMVGDILCLL